jgi:hypothetical protein
MHCFRQTALKITRKDSSSAVSMPLCCNLHGK